MKNGIKVLLVSDFHVNVFCWRKEILDAILNSGGKVAIAVPYGEKLEYFKTRGCQLYDVEMDRHSLSLKGNLILLLRYRKILKDYKPDAVLLYGSKGMLYAGYFCKKWKIPFYPNINGLGVLESLPLILRKFMFLLYRIVVPKATCVFFQNQYNMTKLRKMGISGERMVLLPGSGVNLEDFSVMQYPKNDEIHFLYCARVMRQKGIFDFVEAAKIIKNKMIKCKFDIIGMCDDNESEQLLRDNENIVTYYGFQNDIRSFLEKTNCVVLPSFYGEGISNSLLESAACGKPIITTDMPGCKETVIDNVSGYIIEPQKPAMLADAIEKFSRLSYEEQKQMGLQGRKYIEERFSRKIVVDAYMRELDKIS